MGFRPFFALLSLVASTQAYWLMGAEDFLTTERMDPVVSPGKVSGHVHSVLGGSNFRLDTSTESLRQSECTSIPIPEDKSNYWFPHLYFQWANGSFTSLNGGAVIYYLFSDKPGTTTAFPDDFRMLSGDPTLRTYDPNSYAQQAVTFLCLDFNGVTTRHNSLPAKSCPSGIRAQINFPSCWDGKNVDSADHKSHVSFLSGGPDSGTCSDPKFPVTLPRIFIEVYWASNDFEQMKPQAMNPSQPFVYSYGDPTGYGYHADFINGWDKGVLQNAVDKCHCDIYGSPQCCANQGIFHLNQGKNCRITKSINEQTTGTLPKLPGNNPVQPEGKRATMFPDTSIPQLISPVYAYTGDTPSQTGSIVPGGSTLTTTMVKPSLTSATGPAYSSAPQPSPSSSNVPRPSPSSSNAPQPSPSSSVSSSTGHPTSLTPVYSSPVVVTPPQTSASHSTSTQAPVPSPPTSPHDPAQPSSTATTYVHTIPATTSTSTHTTKNSFPTFSFPSVPIPTISIPYFPGGGVTNTPNGSGNSNGNGHGGSNPGSNGGSNPGSGGYGYNPGSASHSGGAANAPDGCEDGNENGNGGSDSSSGSGSGSGSGLDSVPHYYPNPGAHVPNAPKGNGLINKPSTPSPVSSPSVKPKRCPNRKRSKSKRSPPSDLDNLLVRTDAVEAQADDLKVAPVGPRKLERILHSHRRRFMNRFMD